MLTAPSIHRLCVAVEANSVAYRAAVQTSAPGDCWDFVVLTAANEKQAQTYQQELNLRHRTVGPMGAFFPAIQRSAVVADPPGRRAGSGGATLGAIQFLSRTYNLRESDLDRLHILIIHSGGASQRLPAYSPLGKIFAPLPLLRPDGQISTLFDHLYLTLAGLPPRLGPGMLVVAGDVFFLFDHRHVAAPPPGVTALTIRVDAALAQDHGAFATTREGRIRQTLQKASPDELQQAGAVDERGKVLIDTGLLFFDAFHARKIAALAGCGDKPSAARRRKTGIHERLTRPLDLYQDITAALAGGTDKTSYLADPATLPPRRELWNALHGSPFQVMELDGQFLHLGTTRQFRDAMVGRNDSPAASLFQQNLLARGDWKLASDRRVYHSALLGENGQAGEIGAGSLVEHSILGAFTRIGAGSVVSQVLAVDDPVRLGDNLLFFQVPVQTDAGQLLFAQILCGVDDDFKGDYSSGQCLFLNQPIGRWLRRHRLRAADLWAGVAENERTLWTARLFPAAAQRDSASVALWFDRPTAAPAKTIAAWKKSPRFSMAMLLEQADPRALIEHREVVAAWLQTAAMLDSLHRDEDRPLDTFVGHYSSDAAYDASLSQIAQFASRSGQSPQFVLRQARALWCAAQLLQRPDRSVSRDLREPIDRHMSGAFAKIAEASELAVREGSVHVHSNGNPPPRIRPGVRIEAASPVRLDLAGGWTDAPSYCYDRGGHVINVAIDLEGQPPVRAMVRTLGDPILILESHDLGQHAEIKRLDPPGAKRDVRDPFALHKVALETAGLLPAPGTDLSRHLKKLGGGLIVSTECRVPKGSGLGTSSILGATLLAALHEVVGRKTTPNDLIAQTLLLEQRLSTGGGWQDQVGGIIGGVKSTTTAPGLPQRPVIEQLPLTDAACEALDQRLVVYFSGQQRLARDILRRVMGRWLAREPALLLLMDQLKSSAAALRSALLKGQWSHAAAEMARYWEIKKQLYPGSTTPTIDVLFLELREHYLAAGLAGAGGGGFGYFFCKDARQAGRLRQLLAERSAQPGSMGSLFQTRINRAGLTVTRNAL